MVTQSTFAAMTAPPESCAKNAFVMPTGRSVRLTLRSGGAAFEAARVLRLTRDAVVFELCGPSPGLQNSQSIDLLELHAGDSLLYSGPATTESVAAMESSCLVVASLHPTWPEAGVDWSPTPPSRLSSAFRQFLIHWQHHTQLQPRFRETVEEMTSFFESLRTWTEGLELPLQFRPPEERRSTLDAYVAELSPGVLASMDRLFDRLETISNTVAEVDRPDHWAYLRERLHPLLMCSPFAWRTFAKPLGYPGDFEMVSMIAHQKAAPGSLFARLVDAWFLGQPPAEAHRNRLALLVERLRDETLASRRRGERASVFTLGCGPAVEVARFLTEYAIASEADFVLGDFSQETLDGTRQVLTECRDRHARRTRLEFRRVSVLQFLRNRESEPSHPFSFIYCAGLFDYLQEPTCRQLLDRLYAHLRPGGLLLCTNVDGANPIKHGMSFLLDWHLIYRTAADMARLIPAAAERDRCAIWAEPTGLNLFLEIRKPDLESRPAG